MIEFLKHHFKWKTVGHVRSPSQASRYEISFYITYHMTESGRRRIKLLGETKTKKVRGTDDYVDASYWRVGGPFPKAFVPISDTLAEMLVRMVDKKLEGK